MKVIGLTGQTGAGKSTLSDFAKKLGFAVVTADSVAREAVMPGTDCLKRLAEFFGYDIIDDKGCLKRKLLAERAFSTKENTEMLNRLTHSGINRLAAEYIRGYREEGGMIIYDCPLLFESGGEALCDLTLAVTAPESVRLRRIMTRDSLTEREAMLRIRAQRDEEFYRSRADVVIDGSQELSAVIAGFDELIGRLARERGVI